MGGRVKVEPGRRGGPHPAVCNHDDLVRKRDAAQPVCACVRVCARVSLFVCAWVHLYARVTVPAREPALLHVLSPAARAVLSSTRATAAVVQPAFAMQPASAGCCVAARKKLSTNT